MRDLLRLLMVAVLSFAVVGAALVYSRDTETLAHITALIENVRPQAGEMAVAAPEASEKPAALWIPRPHQDIWMGIAGFPDQYDLRFPVPAGVALTGGELVLDFDAQLAEHGDGRLTITVNDKRRGEVVLNTGRQTHKVEIALDADDLLGSSVAVEIAGRGTTNSGQVCPTDSANSGSAITLLPSSGLALYTGDPLDSIEVRLAALTEPIALALGASASEQASAIWAAQVMTRTGLDMRLAAEGVTSDLVFNAAGSAPVWIDGHDRIVLGGRAGIRQLISARRALMATGALPADWPVGVAQLGAEVVAKNFRGSRRWSVPYALADLPQGRMPTRFNLQLKTSRLAQGNDWVVRVSLNGNMLETQRFPGDSETISMPVSLPLALQGLSNALLVELIDTSPNDSICRAGPDAQAQLLQSSTLIAVGGQPIDGWGEMVRTLARMDSIGLTTESRLDLAQARHARTLLGAFMPLRKTVNFGEAARIAPAQLTIVTGAQLQSSLRIASRMTEGADTPLGGLYLAIPGAASAAPLLLQMGTVEAREMIAGLGAADIGILIAR